MDSGPTGLVYRGKGIKLEASIEPTDSLKELAQIIKGEILKDFQRRYGYILDLLDIPVQSEAMVVLGQYWDDTLRCFTFSDFQLAPTIEEYGEFLRLPLTKGAPVYKYPGQLPSKNTIAKILDLSIDKIQLVCPGSIVGISRAFVEKHLKELAKQKRWASFNRVLAMAIYGIILFPFTKGMIDLHAISVFCMVEYHQVNPVPAILAETYMTLSHCHDKKGGKMKCCFQLLNVWVMNHLYGKKFQQGKRYDNPLSLFKDCEGKTRLDRKGWMEVFNQLRESDILWRLAWWWEEEVICQCGDYLNVPLIGPRGGINYNPMLLLRQFAFSQGVPAEEVVRQIQFQHDDPSTKTLSKDVSSAWDRVGYKSRHELGKRLIWATEEYKVWLRERITGSNPAFAPLDPRLTNRVSEIDQELIKQLERKDLELDKLIKAGREDKESLTLLQKEYTAMQEEMEKIKRRNACEASSEMKRLREENTKLKRTVRDIHKRVEESDQKMKSNRAKLMKAVKEKDAFEKEVQNLQSQQNLSQEMERLARQLEEKTDELIVVQRKSSGTIQDLLEQIRQRTESAENWERLYAEKVEEVNGWRERAERLILLVNDVIPRFSEVYGQIEGMTHPCNASPEIADFLQLCRHIAIELKYLARTW